jgi:hypothetical protein
MYTDNCFTIIYGVVAIYVYCFSSYACPYGAEILRRPCVYKQIRPYQF